MLNRLNPLFGTLMVALSAAMAVPLQAEDDPIERCRLAETDQARIACLEAALRGPQAEPEQAEPPVDIAPPPVTASRDPEPAPEPDSEPEVSAPELSAPVAAPAPPAPSPASDLGAEQVAARASAGRSAEPSPRLNAAVRSAETIHFQRLQVTLDNDQVWRQIRGDNQRVNAANANGQSVEIWESNLGGYRMRLNEMARTIRVERIR